MIPSTELIKRLEKEMKQVPNWGMYEGLKLAIATIKQLEAETQKHLHDNPKAVAATISQIKRDHWDNHRRWTIHRPKKVAA